MQTVAESVKQYVETWYEKGAKNVKAALEKCWTAENTDADPNNAPVKESDALAALIERDQEHHLDGK